MTEHLKPNSAHAIELLPSEAAEVGFLKSETALGAHLDALAGQLPQVEKERAIIEAGGAELIRSFAVQPEFFDDAHRSTIFASLALTAGRLQQVRSGNDSADRQEMVRQKNFVADATFLLTRNFSDANSELVERHSAQTAGGSELSAAEQKTILDGFVNVDLTERLSRQLASATQTSQGSDKPAIQVLSLGPVFGTYFQPNNNYSAEDLNAWQMRLHNNAAELDARLPQLSGLKTAFGAAVSIDNNKFLYVNEEAAAILLADELGLTLSEWVKEENIPSRASSIIYHEMAHAEDNLRVEDVFGRFLEERRAEWKSGNKGNYFRVKRFFNNMRILYGVDIGDVFDEISQESHNGGNSDAYAKGAQRDGFDFSNVASIAAIQPDEYSRLERSEFVQHMQAELVGWEALIERMKHDPGIDTAAALHRVTKTVNDLRANLAFGNAEAREEFIAEQLKPLFAVLGVSITDIPKA